MNETSLQGQFSGREDFIAVLTGILAARARVVRLRNELRTTRMFPEGVVAPGITVRSAVQGSRDRDLLRAVLSWLDQTGPFVENERLEEIDDYFECIETDVTDAGLGEATRRVKSKELASAFSFQGGPLNFAASPLIVYHGLEGDRLGAYYVDNVWSTEELTQRAILSGPSISSWRTLVEAARERFPNLIVADSVYENRLLAREPFDPAIRERTLVLFDHLNSYMADRGADGAEGPVARGVVQNFFVGERALFTGESQSNQNIFRTELTFADPEIVGGEIFAHWHGKISHRVFRVHFEWPVPSTSRKLKILYLGPKITKG
ncbi:MULTISPECIES: hypothetical protein [unclassified Mesorhizobium]|uniref:hypothetical protein n=1 Tax=unclassified Mesorhizobium TaxID=325217 RepID=UPI003339A72F